MATPVASVYGAVALTAAGLGVLAGLSPRAGVAAALGLVFVAIVVADISLGLCLFVIMAFLDLLPGLSGSLLSLVKVAGLLLALSWLAYVTTRGDAKGTLMGAHPVVTYVMVLFLVWTGISTLWAEAPGNTTTDLQRYALNFVLFVIVFTAVRTRQHARWVIGTFVTGTIVAGAYGIVTNPDPDADRLASTLLDPNELAALLVAGLVLSAALAVTPLRGSATRLLAGVGSVVCAVGICLTVSRGGLVALGVVLVGSLAFAGRWRSAAAPAAVLTALLAVVYFTAIAPPEARERVTTLGGGTGRIDIWTVGWRMVEANPVRGVGAGNFQVSSVHYLLEPGAIRRADFIVDRPKVAHNIYLQVLAELGVIGLALFLGIIGFAVGCAARAARLFERHGDVAMEVLARALTVGLAGILAADFFLSDNFSKHLWLLLGLGPALLAIARRGAASGPTAGAPRAA